MLRVTLRIGNSVHVDYEIRRITNTAHIEQHPDQVNTYLVSRIPDLAVVGEVTHRYGDGPEALASAALILSARQPLPPRQPAAVAVTRQDRLRLAATRLAGTDRAD